jgi:hypothetical protein
MALQSPEYQAAVMAAAFPMFPPAFCGSGNGELMVPLDALGSQGANDSVFGHCGTEGSPSADVWQHPVADAVDAGLAQETFPRSRHMVPGPGLPLNSQDADNCAKDGMIESMMKKREDEEATKLKKRNEEEAMKAEEEAEKAVAEAQAMIDAKKKARAEAVKDKVNQVQCRDLGSLLRTEAAARRPAKDAEGAETVLVPRPTAAAAAEAAAPGASVDETASAGESGVAGPGRKLKMFSFRFNPIKSRSSAFQTWRRSEADKLPGSFGSSADLSTSAGFSTSGSSDDGSSAKDCKRSSEESSEQSSEAGCVGTDQLSADGSPPSGRGTTPPPSEVQAAKMPAAKVTRRPFGTRMPCAVQIAAAA